MLRSRSAASSAGSLALLVVSSLWASSASADRLVLGAVSELGAARSEYRTTYGSRLDANPRLWGPAGALRFEVGARLGDRFALTVVLRAAFYQGPSDPFWETRAMNRGFGGGASVAWLPPVGRVGPYVRALAGVTTGGVVDGFGPLVGGDLGVAFPVGSRGALLTLGASTVFARVFESEQADHGTYTYDHRVITPSIVVGVVRRCLGDTCSPRTSTSSNARTGPRIATRAGSR